MLATLEIMASTTLAHTWAGGTLPAVPWLIGVTCMVFGASLLVIRGVAPLRWTVLGLGAAQLLLHSLLSVMTPAAGHTHMHGGGGSFLDLSWGMLAAHLASAIVTAVVWRLRRRFLEVILHGTLAINVVPVNRSTFRPVDSTPSISRRGWLLVAPTRGPPGIACCA